MKYLLLKWKKLTYLFSTLLFSIIIVGLLGLSTVSAASSEIIGGSTLSGNNPNKVKFSTEYSTRVDSVITRILQRGRNLNQTQYINYLTNLSIGIKEIALKPAYSNNTEVQNIVAYIDYELTHIRTSLSTGEMFMEDFIKLLDSAMPTTATGSTTTSAPTCSWGGFVTGAGTPGRVCNSSTVGQTDSNGAVCSCTGESTTSVTPPKTYLSNVSRNDIQVSTLNGTIYNDQVGYIIMEWVSASTPPKGCAKPKGSTGCNVVSVGFREFTTAEGRGTSRIVSTVGVNEFPVGEYEFYLANGSVITLAGTGKMATRATPPSELQVKLQGACKIDYTFFDQRNLKHGGGLNTSTSTFIMDTIYNSFVYNGDVYMKNMPGRLHGWRNITTNAEALFVMCVDGNLLEDGYNDKLLYTTPPTTVTVTAPTCSWGGFVTGAGTPGRVCNSSTVGQTDSNGAVCSCR